MPHFITVAMDVLSESVARGSAYSGIRIALLSLRVDADAYAALKSTSCSTEHFRHVALFLSLATRGDLVVSGGSSCAAVSRCLSSRMDILNRPKWFQYPCKLYIGLPRVLRFSVDKAIESQAY